MANQLVSEATQPQWLVAICRAGLNHEPMMALNSIGAEAWAEIIDCAEAHGMLSLLYFALIKANGVPADKLRSLEQATQTQAIRSCAYANELVEIVDSFKRAGIDSLSLKGPIVAARAYGNLASRQSRDLDILVHPKNVKQAVAIIEQRGFRIQPGTSGPNDPPEPGSYHFIFVRKDNGTIVELHWALNSAYERAPIESTGVWSRAEDVLIGYYPIRTLSLEDTLLHLCVHGFKHEWRRIKWTADIAYFLRSGGDIDWSSLLSRAREIGSLRMLFVGLHLASATFGVSLPKDVAQMAARDRTAKAIAEQFRVKLLRGESLSNMESTVCRLHARERFQDQTLLFAELVRRIFRLTSEDGDIASMSTWSIIKLTLKRPLRLYRTYGTSWLKPAIRLR